MKLAEVGLFFDRLAEADPTPQGELDHRNPFELLVAVVLSAQATDVSVNRATGALFAAAPTPSAMLTLGEAGIRGHIATIGLYNSKARHLVGLCQALLDRHGGAVPSDREALEALPGVGRKTANVVMNTAFGAPTLAVDTHVFRVANRTGIGPGATPLAVEKALLRRVPKRHLQHAHLWLILHGRYRCTARRPCCSDCPVNDLCDAHRRGLIPNPR